MNTDYHNSFTEIPQEIFYRSFLDFHLTLAVLPHYLAKYENPIYSCFKNNALLFSYFLNRQSFAIRGVGILQERVYKHHRITDAEKLRQCVEEEWDHLDQEVIDNAISGWRKRLTACVAACAGHFEHSL